MQRAMSAMIAISLVLVGAGPLPAEAADQKNGQHIREQGRMGSLSRYVWKNRVLVLFGASNDADLARQIALLAAQEPELADRDMVVIAVSSDKIRVIHGDGAGLDAETVKADLGRVEGHGFEAVLIGKDGGVKLRSSEMVGAGALFGLIDSMPMRKAGN